MDEDCASQYANIDKGILQFLYKVDGNLGDINKSKIKRIDYLKQVFRDYKKTKDERRKAFSELWSDPDYWQYKVQSGSRALIEKYEFVNKNSGWVVFKKDVDKLVSQNNSKGGNWFGLGSMQAMRKLDSETRDFFEVLDQAERRLEQLRESDRFRKFLGVDKEKQGAETAYYKGFAGWLLGCQIDYLEFAIGTR